MAGNRKNERRQAVLRLTAQRDSLREERTLLEAMVEAARPSMPSLKKPAAAPSPAVAGKGGATVPGKSRGSSPQQSSPLPPPSGEEALASAGVVSRKLSEEKEEEEEEEEVEPNVR
ncbi:unnamed protein product, partial [Laminaria digitata]